MTNKEFRLECLKMAYGSREAGERVAPYARAERLFQFIMKEEPKKKPGPKPRKNKE